MSAKKLLIAVVILISGFLSYSYILPYYFSQPKPLTPEVLTGFYDKNDEKGVFHGQEVVSYYQPDTYKLAKVLGESTGKKRVEVDLTNQKLYAYEGDNKIYDFLISSGKWGRTPTGIFEIWIKLKATKMEGGNKALNTYYYLPNVPYVMFFANNEIPRWRGYGLHGTYWHSNFGHPMSHGCINLKTEDAEKLYWWTTPELNGKSTVHASESNPGTPVIIYGTAPNA